MYIPGITQGDVGSGAVFIGVAEIGYDGGTFSGW